MNFFIFATPRSRSAWLSVFLTGKDSFCYHELTVEDGWKNTPTLRDEKVVGAVDTLASLYPDTVYAAFPKASFFTLERDRNEINASIKKLGFDLDARQIVLPKHNRIYFDKLNDVGYLAEIWSMIIGEGFDAERAKMLIDMNVQRDINSLILKMNKEVLSCQHG